MASYLIYDIATGAPLFTQASRNAPALPAEHGFIAVDDGTVTGVGDTVVDGALVRYVPTIADHRAEKVRVATAWFNGLFALPNGFTFAGKLYQMDEASRANWVILGVGADRSAADPMAFPWTDIPVIAADNSSTPMDAPTARAFSQAAIAYWAACRPAFRAIKDAIAGAADETALDAIDVTTGYPAASA
jgi:hypothetical protein